MNNSWLLKDYLLKSSLFFDKTKINMVQYIYVWSEGFKIKLFVCIQTLLYIHNHNGMIKTKIQKAIALAGIATIATASSLGGALNTYAALQIGTGSVTTDVAFDTAIIWDETYTDGSAVGSVSDIIVTAKVLPTLNMTVSTGAIDLGTLIAGVESNGSLGIEIGTNAARGVTITARSGSGGLTNTTTAAHQINNDDLDGESYTFAAIAGANDSGITGTIQSADVAAFQVNDNIAEHTIYSTVKGEKNDVTVADVAFTVAAITTAETAAWDYEDKITFTVTGNF